MGEANTPPPGVDAVNWELTSQSVCIPVVALQRQVLTLSEQVGAPEERGRRRSRTYVSVISP